MSAKRGKYNKDNPRKDHKADPMRGLSSSVKKACEKWLAKRDIKSVSWKEQSKSR